MAEYISFMHDDVTAEEPSAWKAYLQGLDWEGVFEGGSEIGICVRKGGAPPDVTQHLAGYIRATIEAAKSLLAPAIRTSKTGGTVEIGELPRM